MVDCEIDCQDLSVTSSSNTQAEESKPSTILQLPMELVSKIWGYLDLKERVKVQRVSKFWLDHSRTTKSLWKDVHLFKGADFNQAADCKDVEILSQISKWTEIPTLAIILQMSTKEQIAASKKLIALLPSIKVQNLLIKKFYPKRSVEFYDPSWQSREYVFNNFEDIPGLYCLGEEVIQVLKEIIGLSTGEEDYMNHLSTLYKAIEVAEDGQNKALLNAISTFSNLRSLILDVDFDVLTHFSQDKPIAQCKLDILSIASFSPDIDLLLKAQHREAIYDMVKEARVIDLVNTFNTESFDKLGDLLSKASSTLEYLAIRTPNRNTMETKYEGPIINLPKLTYLHFLGHRKPPFRIHCPNLDSLMVNNNNDLEWFENNPSIGSLFIDDPTCRYFLEARENTWNRLIRIGAERLHTLYFYNHCISEDNFLSIFLQANIFPHLRKVIVLAKGPYCFSKPSLNSFNELSPTQLLDVRKIDSLIWQCEREDEFPTSSTQEFIGEHFATNFECIERDRNRSLDDLHYSAELMGDFVRFRSVNDKADYFQKFLQRSSKAKASGSA